MSNLFIAPYKLSNTASKELARNLGCLRIRPEHSRYQSRPHHRVINWGRSFCPFPVHANQPHCVQAAVDKRVALSVFKVSGVPTLEFGGRNSALTWLQEGYTVYARTKLTGMGGSGIVIVNGLNDLDSLGYCPLFTKRFNTHREFRVHVAFGQTLITLEKKKRRGTTPDPLVRSHHRDWVFCQHNLDPIPDTVQTTAVAAVAALGLDFGGVDLAIDRNGNVAVFEVNTAPGLEGTSLLKYTEAFRNHFHD